MSIRRLYRLVEGPFPGMPVIKRALAAKFPHFDELLKGWVKYAQRDGIEDATFYIEDEGYANWGSKMTDDDVKMIQVIVKAEAGIDEAGEPNDPTKDRKKHYAFKAGGKDRSHLANKPSPERDAQLHQLYKQAADASPKFFGGKPTPEPSQKKMSLDDFPDDDEDDDYDEIEDPDDGYDPVPSDEPEPEPTKEPSEKPKKPQTAFAAKSAKPSPALQGGKTGGSLKADKLTLDALERALESVRTADPDLENWIEDCLSEIGRAIRSGGELTLPKFEATPGDLEDE